MSIPRVAAIHDMSGFGRCSLTVILPVLSAMGIQCCPLPTAFLSTHTGGFSGFTFLDMTDEMEKIAAHWKNLGLCFDAVYSGFLGSERQVEIVCNIIDTLKNSETVTLVDPVMGDNGKPYKTYTAEMCKRMGDLTANADIITPNPTEAAILLNEPYDARPASHKDAERWLLRLSNGGKSSVVLTGLEFDASTIGVGCFDRLDGSVNYCFTERIPCEYPGTGDLYSCLLLGYILTGETLFHASAKAAKFVHDCAAHTLKLKAAPRDGVEFEPLLKNL